ncbi:MAG TPA: hypothetical protein VFE78_16375 [Gemmataceae bacterium]|nr:hypothetical protein [Gemmataceae bacterium]
MVLRSLKGVACGVAGAVFLVAGVLAGVGPVTALFGRPEEQPAASPPILGYPIETTDSAGKPAKKWNAEELRKRYAFESLADRLKYESAAKDAPAPKLGAGAQARLADSEKWFDQGKRWGMRTQSLQKLHSAEVEEFVKREGFGLERMPRPGPQYLELADAPSQPFAAPLAAEYRGGPTVTLPEKGDAPTAAGLRFPAAGSVGQFHATSIFYFAGTDSFGLVRDRDHVAGFRPHQFRGLPPLGEQGPPKPGQPPAKPKERWLVSRLELVSVWKSATPAVYASGNLPRMQELKGSKTRPPTDFEAKALAALRDGEEVVTAATANEVRMVGAVRAAKQCTACHEVKRGTLLGAFSYDLHRDPPVRLK